MKVKNLLIIIFLLTLVVLSGCAPSTSTLTYEEIDYIRQYGYGGDYVIRWPDGYVDVYDGTNYERMQEVLNQWNSAIGGKVKFRLSNNPNSPVKISIDNSLEEEKMCYWGNKYIDYGNNLIKGYTLRVNHIGASCNNNRYQLYLHIFNYIVGLNPWKGGGTISLGEWSKYYQIPSLTKSMVRALYKVPPGYYLFSY